jgi:hypothetical protein
VKTASDNGGPDGQEVAENRGVEHVAAALKGLRFGQVIVTVQDGVIVQIDRVERKRFGRSAG